MSRDIFINERFHTLREKIAFEKAERLERYENFSRWIAEADKYGKIAAENCIPRPMVVRNNLTGETYPPVLDGVCGFGWVTVTPGTCSFARWAVKYHGWRKAYGGGVQLWVGDYGQSYERKLAYAKAYAYVLATHGIKAWGGGRLD